MNRDYSFNSKVATLVGVENAVILHSIMFWITKNKYNDKYKFDGKYWTYNSQQAMLQSFPFFTSTQLKRRISSLIKEGHLEATTKYSRDKKTYWYSVSETIDKMYNSTAGVLVVKPKDTPATTVKINPRIPEVIEVLEYFNLKADKKYSTSNINIVTEELITARLNEGRTVAELKYIIASKVKEWKGDKMMEKFLRPATLFNKTKFYTYYDEGVDTSATETPEIRAIKKELTFDYGRRGIKNHESDALAKKLMALGYNNKDFLNMYLL